MTTCSATETTFEPETSSTWMPFSTAAFRSMWSEPTPAVMQIFRFFAYQNTIPIVSSHVNYRSRCARNQYLLNELTGQVAGVERGRDEDLGLGCVSGLV